MVDIHRLRILRSVISERSIGRAAAALGYTPSAISQQIAALSRETGLSLIERDGRGIVPTESGLILASESDAVFDQIARIDGLVGELRDGRLGQLRISYFASAGATWMPPIVATITREFPDIRLDLRLVEVLGTGEAKPADIAIYVETLDPVADDPGFVDRILTVEPYLAVVHANSTWAQRTEIGLRELAEVPWIDNDVTGGPCKETLLKACTSVGLRPDFSIETQDFPTAIRFVAEGIGVSVLPRLGIGDLPPDVVAVPIVDPTPTRTIRARVRTEAAEKAATRRVLHLLTAAVGDTTDA